MAFYVLFMEYFCWNNSNASSGAYALWLRTLKDSAGNKIHRWEITRLYCFDTWFGFNMVNFSKYFC